MNTAGSRTVTAWPHNEKRHVMQLVLGCKPEKAPKDLREITMKQLQKAPGQIAGPGKVTGDFHAGFLHEWNDLREVYGDNLIKLKAVKKAYDPSNRFNKGVDLEREQITPGTTV